MLRLFNGARRMIFFPKSWANGVTRWIMGAHSNSGTVRVSQPADDSGPSFDVDSEVLAQVAEAAFASRFVSRRTQSGIDGESMELDGAGRLRVNTQWLDNFVRQRVKESAQVGVD